MYLKLLIFIFGFQFQNFLNKNKERNLLVLNEYKGNSIPTMAISNLRWRPKTTETILLSATATGHLTLWDVLHSKLIPLKHRCMTHFFIPRESFTYF